MTATMITSLVLFLIMIGLAIMCLGYELVFLGFVCGLVAVVSIGWFILALDQRDKDFKRGCEAKTGQVVDIRSGKYHKNVCVRDGRIIQGAS